MIVDANAMGGFLVINPRSGQGPNAGELRREAERLDIDARILGPGDDPGEVAREAPEGPLGAAGGDGTLAAVADVAVERGWPFVVVPFGTRNHLARDLGLDREDPFTALRAFAGRQARIDVARVNGRLFLNNVSLGLYARMVHEQDGGNTLAQLKALGLLLRHPGGLGVTVDGRNVHARVVVVSNNHYSLDVFSVGARERLDEGALHLVRRARLAAQNLGGARRHGVHGRRPSGIAARGDRRRTGTARDAAALRDRAGRATSASARARLAPLACAGTPGHPPRSPRARTNGTRRHRRAARARPRRCGPSSRS